ncbi:MAG: VOC family protein [Pseudomonadales bacterium]|nr:VOC family protein [Pseudomonadales bacterium]
MAVTLAKEALDVGIITNNGEKMLAFYRDVLGFAQEPSIPFPGLGTIHRLVCGNSILRIVAADNAVEQVAGGAFASRNGIRYLTINISNLDQVVADCKAFGCAIAVDIRELRPGVRCCQLQDPDGNYVEFICAG